MKKIVLLATGGTISAHHDDRLNTSDYVSGHYEAVDWLRDYPEMERSIELTIDQTMNISSTLITDEDWLLLRERVIHHLETADGVVISHGTSTLEETAYFLHLTLPVTKPVVLTGAQRPYSAISSDAPMNLIQALRVAADEEASGKGVLVVANDAIHSARDVTKASTYRLETFESRNGGTLGTVDPDVVSWLRQPVKRHTFSSVWNALSATELPKVAIIYSHAGATGEVIDYLVTQGVEGFVVAGTGAGHMTPSEKEALIRATKEGRSVVLTSRTGSGRVVPIERYASTSFIYGDDLLPQKARILLMLARLQTKDPEQIQRYFKQY